MTSVDFVPLRKIRVVDKGTKKIDYPFKKSEWSGAGFKEAEIERLKLAGDLMIMSGKGTKKVRMSELKHIPYVLPRGYYISTNKGTSRRKID